MQKSTALCCCLLSVFLKFECAYSFIASPRTTKFKRNGFSVRSSSVFDEFQEFQKSQSNLQLVEALVQPKQELLQVELAGQAKLRTSKNGKTTTPCLVLTTHPVDNKATPESAQCLFVPITPQQLKLISFGYQQKPLSKSVLLGLNPLLVNRDQSMFDNLPWATWTVDPQQRNRDAANNFILAKYHMGKRDAFQKFGGKDWKGRSASIGNLALRLKYMLENDQPPDDDAQLLTKRILTLKIQELQEDLAETDYQLAIARNNAPEAVFEWEQQKETLTLALEEEQKNLAELSKPNMPFTLSILDRIADVTTQKGQNTAPYRGAMGYAPLLDTKKDIDDSVLPYTSPFDFMREILEDQLKARVIGSLLENTSLLDGTLTVGGAIILQRITPKDTMTINGEELSINNELEDFGNQVYGGETILVECDVDEAIGMALAQNVPIQVESEIWDRASLTANILPLEEPTEHVLDKLAIWEPADSSLSFLAEGQASNQSVTETPSPLRIPQTTSSFESFFEESSSSQVFPTDNPIQSLDEYDALSQSDKAKTLIELSNFNGKLPRPRVLRNADSNNGISPGPLDELLLPLIDESVRRQYLIRDAELRQDWDTVRQLEAQKSRRQIAKENAEEAWYYDDEEEALRWEAEADFLENIRADVTQDEGSYSRFLDKDEWYEENNRNLAKRLNKKKFGTLLDGIE
mmetsp:Transcript_17405/g.25138  ORF Transcript_17405/g.25138 Transcript_17405/m.25138 type:complete len:692 (-) Transcript_17405:122-2197(-)